ncbi:MAG: LPS export ABC transporter permease LptG [Gammaproteobacteria bacterium]
MRILKKYISQAVISTTIMVMLVIVALQIFITFLGELHSIGWGHYGVKQAFVYMLLSLPQSVYPLFPAGALIGCLIGLGRLASQSELVVMRAAGVSKLQITLAVGRAAVIMLIFMTLLGEWLAPHLQDYAEQYRYKARMHSVNVFRRGFWLKQDENYIYINRALSSGELNGVMRYQFHQGQLQTISQAQHGSYKDGQWVLRNVYQVTLQPDQVMGQTLPTQILPLALNPRSLANANVDPNQTTLVGLYHYIQYLRSTSLSTVSAEFNFFKRLLQPVITLVMIGFAAPFIMGPLRSMTMGLRIVIGVAIGFGFFTLNEFLGPFSLVYNVPPWVAAGFPMLLFVGAGVLMFRRKT